MNALTQIKADQNPAYDRISSAFKDPKVGVTQDTHRLDSILGTFEKHHGISAFLGSDAMKDIGLPTLQQQGSESIRSAALEAQARCIESDPDLGTKEIADRLRRMGPSAEAVAYGYDQMIRNHGFEATPDRVLAEGARAALVSFPGADRSANMSLQQGTSRWRGTALPAYDRHEEAAAFYSKLPDNELLDAARASQEAYCEEINLKHGNERQNRVTALATMRAIGNADAKGLLMTQSHLQKLDGRQPERPHPMAIISNATASVIQEREAARSKTVDAKRTQDER